MKRTNNNIHNIYENENTEKIMLSVDTYSQTIIVNYMTKSVP